MKKRHTLCVFEPPIVIHGHHGHKHRAKMVGLRAPNIEFAENSLIFKLVEANECVDCD